MILIPAVFVNQSGPLMWFGYSWVDIAPSPPRPGLVPILRRLCDESGTRWIPDADGKVSNVVVGWYQWQLPIN